MRIRLISQVVSGAFGILFYSKIACANVSEKKNGNVLPDFPMMSVDHRVGKMFFVAVEPFGRIPSSGFGLRSGYFITPDSFVGVNYSQGTLAFVSTVYESNLFELTYKRFFTNSFYMDAGIASEQLEVKYEVVSAVNSFAKVQSEAFFQRSGLVLHLGNQWQWRRFTVGCDWLGHHLPLVKKETFNAARDGDITDEGRQKQEVRSTTRSTLQLVRIYFGFSF